MFAIKDERLKANYKEMTTNIINIFQEALSSNTYYTDHGQKHSARVINHLGLLVDNFEEVFKLSELTDAEKYLLCMASHLHDLGMAIEKYEKNEEKRRSNHSELSARFVEENESLLGLVGDLRGIKTPLKDIIRTHRKQYDIPEYIKDPEPRIGNFGTIRLDLLAAIFRIGDASDVDYMRAHELTSTYVINLPEEHKMHWEACQIIDGIKFDGASIKLTATKDYNELSKREHLLLLYKLLDLYAELVSVQAIFLKYEVYLSNIVVRYHDGREEQIFDILRTFFLKLDKGVRVLFVGIFECLTEIKIEKGGRKEEFKPFKPIESLVKCGLGFKESVKISSELLLELIKDSENIHHTEIADILSRKIISTANLEVYRRYDHIYGCRKKFVITENGIEEFSDIKVKNIILNVILDQYEKRGFKNFEKHDVERRWKQLINRGYNKVIKEVLNTLGTDYVHEWFIKGLVKELLFEPPRPWFSSAQLPNNWKLLVRWGEEHYSNAEKALAKKNFEKVVEELTECLSDIYSAILNSFDLPIGCGTLASFERLKIVIKEIASIKVKEEDSSDFKFYTFLNENKVGIPSFLILLKTINKNFRAFRSKIKYSPKKDEFEELMENVQNLRNCIERLVLIKEKEKVEKLFRETTKSSKDDKLLDLAEYLFREIPHTRVFKAEKSKTVNVTYDPLNHVNKDLDEMDINSTSGGLTILCTFKSKRGKGEYNLDLNALKRYVRSIDDTPYFTDFIKKELKL